MATVGLRPKIYIIFYSTYGHILSLAKAVQKGVEASGAEGILYQVPETLPLAVLEKMHAPAHPFPDIPVIAADDLPGADGFLFGFPTRFGAPAAQMKSFLDSTGGLWAQGKLVGKHAGVFFSTGTQGGGQETTALTFLPVAVHHGLQYVPIGYSCDKLTNMTEVHGGSPWGAGTLAGGDGSRLPSALELAVGEHQGSYFANVVKTYKAGQAALEKEKNGN